MFLYAIGFVVSNLSDLLVMTTTNYKSNLEFLAYWKQSATYTTVSDDSCHPQWGRKKKPTHTTPQTHTISSMQEVIISYEQ